MKPTSSLGFGLLAAAFLLGVVVGTLLSPFFTQPEESTP